MKPMRILRGGLVVLASFGMLFPQVACGIGPVDSGQALAYSSTAIRDIALQENGLLKGQVLDTQGAPVTGVPVAVVQQGKVIAATKTDATGHFAITGLKGGVFQVVTAQGGAAYRLWAPRTAPPAAQADALIVNGDTVVRGGMGGAGFLSNPWVLGGIVAAAIAIPLAMDDGDDDAS
jgi:hypothetical protein